MSDHPPVHEAWHSVMADLGAIGKEREGPREMGGFAYRGVDDILDALQPILVEHGVTLTPEIVEHSSSVTGRARLVSMVVRYHVRGPAGDLLVPSPMGMGDGMSGQAQAPNIAMSNAFKTCMFQALCIAVEGTTVDSEEGPGYDHSAPPAPPVKYADQATLDQIAARARALPVETRTKLTAWKEAEGISLKGNVPLEVAEKVSDKLDELSQEPFEGET